MIRKKAARYVMGLLVLLTVFFLGFAAGENRAQVPQVTIYEQKISDQAPQPVSGTGAETGPVDLNTATADRLDELPGIGPALAEAIVTYRTEHGSFVDKIQLMDVPGIGETKYAALEQLIMVKEAQ